MPGKLGHPCAEPRCPEIISDREKYCEKHRALYPSHRHNQRVQDRLPLYHTQQWKRLRRLVLSQNPLCQRCWREVARVVHHIKPAREYPELQYVLENLEALCDSCHNKESQREKTATNLQPAATSGRK